MRPLAAELRVARQAVATSKAPRFLPFSTCRPVNALVGISLGLRRTGKLTAVAHMHPGVQTLEFFVRD